jgi:hypothetical protein
VTHEFGHMALRALGFIRLESAQGRIDAQLEETLCDFIASSLNSDTPFIGVGLQNQVKKFAQDGLKEPGIGAFQKAMIEGHLQGVSDKAMRDLTMPLVYEKHYLLPGHYVSSMHYNALFFRLKKVVPAEHFTNAVLQAVVEQPSIFMFGDAREVVRGLVAFYARKFPAEFRQRKKAILAVLNRSGWHVPGVAEGHLQLELSDDAQKALNVRIKPNPDLTSSVFPATMRTLTYTLYANHQPRFSMAQFLDDSSKRRFRLIPTASCDPSSVVCFCGSAKSQLSIDGIFLNQHKKVVKTGRTSIPATSLQSSECYTLSFEWE